MRFPWDHSLVRIAGLQQHPRHRGATHTLIQQNQRIRPPGKPMRGGPVARQRYKVLTRSLIQETAADHADRGTHIKGVS